ECDEMLIGEDVCDTGDQVAVEVVDAFIELPRAQRVNGVVHAVLGRLRDLLSRYDVPIASRGVSLDAGRGTGRESEQRYREACEQGTHLVLTSGGERSKRLTGAR